MDVLDEYLEENRERYEKIKGDQLTVNLDNHDEDIFIKDGKPSFIDLLPPMSCWWYGLPHTNLSNIMVNIEALHSNAAADIVKTGYLKYHKIDSLSEQELAFTRAFSYLISVAHFGSLPDKAEVTQKYIKQLKNIPNWF
ncbi:MAG: hypothetical protein LR008_02195 [Candidatus Pacebacteria bacterium]|nr:hypothetical protein [Candidatus Paceibacterota bacterium]